MWLNPRQDLSNLEVSMSYPYRYIASLHAIPDEGIVESLSRFVFHPPVEFGSRAYCWAGGAYDGRLVQVNGPGMTPQDALAIIEQTRIVRDSIVHGRVDFYEKTPDDDGPVVAFSHTGEGSVWGTQAWYLNVYWRDWKVLSNESVAKVVAEFGTSQAFELLEHSTTYFRNPTFWHAQGDDVQDFVESVDPSIFDVALVRRSASRYWIGKGFRDRGALLEAVEHVATIEWHYGVACMIPSDTSEFEAAAAPYASWGEPARTLVRIQKKPVDESGEPYMPSSN
jgi:hypothetical protein